jgi:hypothetical protein
MKTEPDCPCFENPVTHDIMMTNMVAVVQSIGALLVAGARSAHLCEKTLPVVMEMAIINMATILGTRGTAIELGSQEAQWETERVLTGIEGRLMERVRVYYEMARELGLEIGDDGVVRATKGEKQ